MSVSPEVLKKIKKVAFYSYEPHVQDVLWAKPVGDGIYEFYAYYNGTWNSITGGEDEITINISDVTGDLSTFNNDAGFVTSEDIGSAVEGLYEKPSDGIPKFDLSSSVQSSLDKADSALPNTTTLADLEDATHKTVTPTEKETWNAKQDAIADLADIRSGAALGATALQSFTETDPTVPAWAKEATKPTYTASEVGALPSSTEVINGFNININFPKKSKILSGGKLLVLTYDEEYLLPITSEYKSAATKTLTDLDFDPFGQVYYYPYAQQVQADSYFSLGSLWTQATSGTTVDPRYSFNLPDGLSSLTPNRSVYLVMVPQSNGRCKLHSIPYSQSLPTTEDGLVYKHIGFFRTNSMSLLQDKPCYYYKDGKLRLWTGG